MSPYETIGSSGSDYSESESVSSGNNFPFFEADYVEYSLDYTSHFNEIISNQHEQIELLEYQNEILLEQINGFSYIANMLYSIVGIMMIVIASVIIWRILNRWFFRGV